MDSQAKLGGSGQFCSYNPVRDRAFWGIEGAALSRTKVDGSVEWSDRGSDQGPFLARPGLTWIGSSRKKEWG